MQFLKQAEGLADEIFNSKVYIVMAIIKGIINTNKKKQIYFEYYKDSDFIFKKVKKLI